MNEDVFNRSFDEGSVEGHTNGLDLDDDTDSYQEPPVLESRPHEQLPVMHFADSLASLL